MADPFESAIQRLLSRIGPGESISPAEAAREASQETGVEWEQLLRAVRRAAVKLALEGRAVILLKGKAVDPENFRGIYRIGGGDYFTPRKAPPAYAPPPPSLAPARDYKPEPRSYTPPALSPPPAPVPASAPSPVRLAVRINPPAANPTPAPEPPAAVTPLPPPPVPDAEPVPHPRLEPQHLSFEDASFEDGASEIEPNETPPAAETQWAIDEGTPVTRFEFDPRGPDEDGLDEDGPDAPGEAREGEAEPPAPVATAPLLSFDDDEYEDEDAYRAPQSATLDEIASELERYLAAELNHAPRGDAEIGDDIVRLPRQQDE